MVKNNSDLEKKQGEKDACSLGLSLNQQPYKNDREIVVYKIRVMKNKVGEKLFIDRAAERLWRLQRRIKAWCALADGWKKQGAKLIMATLTYRPGESWGPEHITGFLQKVKRDKNVELFAYAWVAELMKNGSVHYHVMMYVKGKIKMPDKSGMWTHGSSKVESARTAFYLLMHAGKKYQKNFSRFPKGIRAFGVWVGDVNDREELKLSMVPKWVEKLLREGVGREVTEEIREYKKKEEGWKYYETIVFEFEKKLEMQ
jgi:hypothetical protein